MREQIAAHARSLSCGTWLSHTPVPNCFTPGTRISTPSGERPVEELMPGDLVHTRDNGVREVCWTGQRGLTTADLERHPHLRPVFVPAGAFGDNQPQYDTLFSPNHRVLSAGDLGVLPGSPDEVFLAAKHLTGQPGVHHRARPWVTYIHFMCADHEVVLSNGLWTETFQPVAGPVDGIGNAQRLEIEELFPDLATPDGLAAYAPARPTLSAQEVLQLTP